MKIVVNQKSRNLASVNHASGVVTVNKAFTKLPLFTQNFIIQHEKGHFFLHTKNEFLADKYAFEQLAGKEKRSLKNSIKTLANTLPFNTREHTRRLEALIKLAALYDYKNGNKKALKLMNKRFLDRYKRKHGVIGKPIVRRRCAPGYRSLNNSCVKISPRVKARQGEVRHLVAELEKHSRNTSSRDSSSILNRPILNRPKPVIGIPPIRHRPDYFKPKPQIKPFNVIPPKATQLEQTVVKEDEKEAIKENDGLNIDVSVNDKEKDLLSTQNIIIGVGVIIVLIFLFRSK